MTLVSESVMIQFLVLKSTLVDNAAESVYRNCSSNNMNVGIQDKHGPQTAAYGAKFVNFTGDIIHSNVFLDHKIIRKSYFRNADRKATSTGNNKRRTEG